MRLLYHAGILLCDGIQLKIYTLLKGDKNMYDVKSMKAEEFISDEEIRETLEYAGEISRVRQCLCGEL